MRCRICATWFDEELGTRCEVCERMVCSPGCLDGCWLRDEKAEAEAEDMR